MTASENTEPVRVKWTLSIGISNAYQEGEFEIARDKWNALDPVSRDLLVEEMYQVEVNNHMDGGCEVLNADLNDPVKD